jgi:hypothetical protein
MLLFGQVSELLVFILYFLAKYEIFNENTAILVNFGLLKVQNSTNKYFFAK